MFYHEFTASVVGFVAAAAGSLVDDTLTVLVLSRRFRRLRGQVSVI